MLYQGRSRFQEICLVEEPSGHLSLTLDEVWQFHSRDEHIFHEVLADSPILLALEPKRVLILGGGDGLALRNVLRYPEVEAVTLCELDPQVIELTRSVPEMVELSENCLADPRVEVVIGDALELLETGPGLGQFEVVICDFPAATRPELEPLFAAEFYRLLRGVTLPHSVVSVQVSQDPAGFWPVCAAVEASFPWLHPMLVNLNLDGADEQDWADFVIASDSPKTPMREAATGTQFITAERVGRLRITSRGGEQFETLEYGVT